VSQASVVLLTIVSVNDDVVRAQWYVPHEWLAMTTVPNAPATIVTVAAMAAARVRLQCLC
jgi:hypothetical protein